MVKTDLYIWTNSIFYFFFCSESFHTLSWSRAWIVRYHLHESTLDKSSHHFTYLAKTEFFSPRLIVIQHTAHQAHQDQLFVLQCHVIQSRSFSWQGPRLHCIRLCLAEQPFLAAFCMEWEGQTRWPKSESVGKYVFVFCKEHSMEVSGPPKLQKLINQLRFFYLSDWSGLFFFSQRCFCVRQLTVTHTNKSSYLDITSEHYFPRNSVRLTLNNKLCSNSTLKSMKHQDRTWHIHQTAFCSRLKYDVTAPQRSKSLTLQGPQGNGRISGFNRRKRAWQNRPAPIFSHWLPWHYNDLIQEVYDSLVSSCPLCTTMVCSNHTVGP